MEINIFGATHPGLVRTNNEDAFLAELIWDENHFLAVAIDGVGGHNGGEVAAQIARDSIITYLKKYPNGERNTLLKQAVTYANNTIFNERKNQPEFSNMSCVLTACLIELPKLKVHMAHVGDTRLYKWANGVLKKLSHDHSLIGYREEIGDLSEVDAMQHPQRNIIGRDVGSELHKIDDEDFIELATFGFMPGDILLICSDGLCDMLRSSEIANVLNGRKDIQSMTGELIDKANLNGGLDNITVVLVEFKPDDLTIVDNFSEIKGGHKLKQPVKKTKIKTPTSKLESNFQDIGTIETKQSTLNLETQKKSLLRSNYKWVMILLLGLFAGGTLGWFCKDIYLLLPVLKQNKEYETTAKSQQLTIDSLKIQINELNDSITIIMKHKQE